MTKVLIAFSVTLLLCMPASAARFGGSLSLGLGLGFGGQAATPAFPSVNGDFSESDFNNSDFRTVRDFSASDFSNSDYK